MSPLFPFDQLLDVVVIDAFSASQLPSGTSRPPDTECADGRLLAGL
jgi:hypothetical protein